MEYNIKPIFNVMDLISAGAIKPLTEAAFYVDNIF
jgi:hypothetical protein